MRMIIKALTLALAVCVIGPLQPLAAQEQEHPRTPIMLSFVTPLQVPTRTFDVFGLRASFVYGECHDFCGLDVGAVGRATGNSTGIQIALLATVTGGDGLGLQFGTVNYVKGTFGGLQAGVVNYAANARCFQLGVFNGAENIRGFQLGVINVTRTMQGVQVGLVNVIRDNDVPFLPIINGYF